MHLSNRRQGGFSLLEVMVALVVLSVGLLGIVKLEAVAYSSTNVAAKRSIAALEAASLAAMMHVNRGYWASTDPAAATMSVTGTTLTVSAGAPLLQTAYAAGVSCLTTSTTSAAACSVAQLAAYDLKSWQTSLAALLPNESWIMNCGTVSPVSCLVTIKWTENATGSNTAETGTLATPSYTLYIEP